MALGLSAIAQLESVNAHERCSPVQSRSLSGHRLRQRHIQPARLGHKPPRAQGVGAEVTLDAGRGAARWHDVATRCRDRVGLFPGGKRAVESGEPAAGERPAAACEATGRLWRACADSTKAAREDSYKLSALVLQPDRWHPLVNV